MDDGEFPLMPVSLNYFYLCSCLFYFGERETFLNVFFIKETDSTADVRSPPETM